MPPLCEINYTFLKKINKSCIYIFILAAQKPRKIRYQTGKGRWRLLQEELNCLWNACEVGADIRKWAPGKSPDVSFWHCYLWSLLCFSSAGNKSDSFLFQLYSSWICNYLLIYSCVFKIKHLRPPKSITLNPVLWKVWNKMVSVPSISNIPPLPFYSWKNIYL